MWVVGGSGGGKDAGYCEDANPMKTTSLVRQEIGTGFHSDPELLHAKPL